MRQAHSHSTLTVQVYVAANDHAKSLPVWTATTLSAVLVGTLMLVVMGLAGYLSFRGATEGNILGIHSTY